MLECTTDDLPGLTSVNWLPHEVVSDYGSWATLLAGFSISGLLWLVARDRQKVASAPLIGLWGSVLHLGLAALLFFEIGGERNCARATFDMLVPTFLLCAGGSALFFYLGALIDAFLDDGSGAEDEGVIKGAKGFTSLVQWIVVLFASSGVLSMNSIVLRLVDGQLWLLAPQAVVVVTTLFTAARTRRWTSWPDAMNVDPQSGTGQARPVWQYLATHHRRPLAISLICAAAIFFSYSATIGIEPESPIWFEVATSVRAALWACVILAILGFRREPKPLSQPPSPSPAPSTVGG